MERESKIQHPTGKTAVRRLESGYAGRWMGCMAAIWVLFLGLSVVCAETTRGIYGVPAIRSVAPSSYEGEMERAGVNAVFVPADENTVKVFKKRGFQVYVSVNAFGGKGGWKQFPDSRPVKSNGGYLGSAPGYKGNGGICPTHPGWRRERLKYIEKIVKELGGTGGIDGIWLDFIRYPGFWEVPEPKIPDTCYCPRCLAKFQRDSGISMPAGLDAKGSAHWIKEHALYQWMVWKKEQIASFVSEVREVLEKNQMKKPLKLGLFLVPWTKGERGDAISYLLAQDPFQLSALADVISPMVYHDMCGKRAEWVGYMCGYYQETAGCLLWPIVQSVECSPKEFGKAVRFAAYGGADGILVYAFSGMGPGFWEQLGRFEVLPDLMGSADYTDEMKDEGNGGGGSRITNSPSVSVTAEDEWGAEWVAPLPACEAGAEYVFMADLFRNGWQNGVYPEVSLWGQRFLVNTHLKAKVFQPVRVNVTCPEDITDPFFRFINRNRNTTFQLARPTLKQNYRFKPDPEVPVAKSFFPGRFFPIGVYGANFENLEEIQKLAINTVILGGGGEALKQQIRRCHEIGLRYVLSVPHDPDRLPVFLNDIWGTARPHDTAFYVNDEPGIWSFPVNRADDINRLIKDRFPASATCMAVVRPQVCRDFTWAADFFMLDQYPVPYMPMTWLADSMDEAVIADKRVGGRKGWKGASRLAAVIQAFGGERYKDLGWPRLPTWREMDCLAFLSVVHGGRAVFFFSYSYMGKTEQGREALGRVVGRLNRVYPWLVEENLDQGVNVRMVSSNRVDSKGRPSVQCCIKKKGKALMVIAVNSIGTAVEALLGPLDATDEKKDGAKQKIKGWREVFSGEDYRVVDGRVRVKFGPYETKAFVTGAGS